MDFTVEVYIASLFLLFPFLVIIFAHFYAQHRLLAKKPKTFKVPLGYKIATAVENYYKYKAYEFKIIMKESLDEFKMPEDPEERYQKLNNRKRYEKEKNKVYWEEKRNDWFKKNDL